MSGRVWTADDVHALGVRTDLVTAGSVLGLSRGQAYELNGRDEFPVRVLRLGSRYVVPVSGLLALLGLDQSTNGEAAVPAAASALPDTPTLTSSQHDGNRTHPA